MAINRGSIGVPWSDGWARFTSQFECVVIDWLLVAIMTATGRNLGLTWDQVSGIQGRAVKRGLARREAIAPSRVGVDETSLQKRHEYVTIVTDLGDSRVLYVADGRGRPSLNGFFDEPGPERTSLIDVIAMDMHTPFIYSAADNLDEVTDKICFDRFHVGRCSQKSLTRSGEPSRSASNAASGSLNSRVQAFKKRANGYRNRARFQDAIYFHLGGLDLYPTRTFHSNS